MKKKIIFIIIVFVIFTLFVFFPRNKVKEIGEMTLREKISQMLMVYYNSDEVDEGLIESLKENQPGGFIVTGDNLTKYNKIQRFISSIKKYSNIPMIIAVDQEGGPVQRLYDISNKKATFIPNMHDVGVLNNKDISYKIGNIIGSEAGSIGCNAVF